MWPGAKYAPLVLENIPKGGIQSKYGGFAFGQRNEEIFLVKQSFRASYAWVKKYIPIPGWPVTKVWVGFPLGLFPAELHDCWSSLTNEKARCRQKTISGRSWLWNTSEIDKAGYNLFWLQCFREWRYIFCHRVNDLGTVIHILPRETMNCEGKIVHICAFSIIESSRNKPGNTIQQAGFGCQFRVRPWGTTLVASLWVASHLVW